MFQRNDSFKTRAMTRMVFSLTLTVLLWPAHPATADTLDSPNMAPDRDTTEKYVTLGDLTATDTDDPPDAIGDPTNQDGPEFTIPNPAPVHWTFTWKVKVKSWDIADPDDDDDDGANDGAEDFEVFLRGKHLIPPPDHGHTPAMNNLPEISSRRGKIFFGKKESVARSKTVFHGDHSDTYWFRYKPQATLTDGTPLLEGLAKVRAQHKERSETELFGTPALVIGKTTDLVSLTYDADSLVLSLSLGPIDGLDNEGGHTGGIDPEYGDDPILAGEPSVTSLEFLGQDDDGRYLFGGGEIEIIDPDEQFVFRAAFSEYVLDSTLPQPQGEALNNFADIDDLEISDVADAEDGPSLFLDHFVERGMFGNDMPAEQARRLQGTVFSIETEIDLVVLTNGFTQSVLDVPVTVRIGGGLSLPCACDGDVNLDGIVNDLDIDVVLNCQGAVPEGECESADINCDGIVDELDLETISCLVDGDDGQDCCAVACDGTAPSIVTADAGEHATRPCPGYIDPRIESDNGLEPNLGVDRVRIVFDRPVRDLDSGEGGWLTREAFLISQTDGDVAPEIEMFESFTDEQGRTVAILLLDRPISLREWTTIQALVEDECGQPIENLGNLGEGVDEPDRVDLAFLPGDIDQNGMVTPFDLLAFRLSINSDDPPAGACNDIATDYLDINRDGGVTPFDLLALRQLILGMPPATEIWAGQSLNSLRP